MDRERWKLAKGVLADACTLSGEAREALIEERCGANLDLRAEIESLLTEYDRQPHFLEVPAAGLAADWLAEVPTRLGAWRILRRIGSGGMADVYLAERADGSYHKDAAVKVLKGGLTGADAQRRFDQEREVLANLDHPYIVKLLDGGVTRDGRPYFVMDYLDGAAVTVYAAANALPVPERLRLFAKVCDAVSYLHAHAILHRDLKPANIAVNQEGEPKLLDFGIAKVLEPLDGQRYATQTGFRYFTPEYASPEQLRGAPATQQGDVYSLGLVLYELLSNKRPDLGANGLDFTTIPRTVAKIIAQATRDDPERRFPSVAAFSAALKRYQDSPQWAPITSGLRRRWIAAGIAVVVLLAGGAKLVLTRSNRASTTPTAPSTTFHRLTSYPGLEDRPSLDPKAFDVVFSRSAGGARGLWILNIFTSAPSQLTEEDDCCAKWSPDGNWIAFARRAGADRFDISLIKPKGGPVRTIARTEGMEMSWARDSTALAVVDRSSPEEPFSIYRVSLTGGPRRRLTNPPPHSWGDTDCAFSPDGRNLAVVRYSSRGNGGVYVIPADGGEARGVAYGEGWINGIGWTADSREVIYAATRVKASNTAGLWRVSAFAGPNSQPTLIPVPRTGGIPERPVVSAGRLVFEAHSWRSNIWKMPLSPSVSALPVRVHASTGEETPAYSPDGKRVAFWWGSKEHDIWSMNLDGSNLSQVSHSHGLYTQWPSWSPDGSRIAYVSNVKGKVALYAVPSVGGESLRLPIGDFEAGAPSWSHDGRWIYFRCERSGSSQVCKIRADGSAPPIQITKQGGVEAFEASDGARLYFLRSHDFGKPLTVPVSGGVEQDLVDPPVVKAGFWTLIQNAIYFLDLGPNRSDDRISVKRFDPTTRKLQILGWTIESGGKLLPHISVRPDGKEIVWSRMESGGDLWLIENFR